ncbi:MAG: hypothetical protein IPP88_18555 [Betaproteobacteria bacterium]|nr:hypothetical protein [Betaproteobacteria bacterium]
MKLKHQFLALIAVIFMGFTIVGGFSYWGLSKMKVNGPIYMQIVQGKDLVADILPPPEYILETHLVVHQLRFATTAFERDALIKRIDALRKDFDERNVYWKQANLDQALNKPFFEEATAPANATSRNSARILYPPRRRATSNGWIVCWLN